MKVLDYVLPIRRWLPWILLIVAGVLIYYRGKSNGELKGKLEALQARADSLEHSVKVNDTVIVRLKDTVKVVQERVVTIDKTIKPKADSALTWLEEHLTVEANAKLKQVTESYEARLKVRDKLIDDQRAVKEAQTKAITQRDSLLVNYRKKTGLLKHSSKAKTIVGGIVVLGAFLAGKVL